VQASIAIDNARLTEALRTEQLRLRESEHAFRLTFEAAPVGMSVLDLRDKPGSFLRVNDAMCRMLGYTSEQLLALSFAEITHPDDLDDGFAAMQRAMSGAEDSYRTEKRYVRADGRPVWVSLSTSVVRDAEGEALYSITQFEDISDRRRAHLELTRLARLDPLTGLLNRTSLLECVDEAIAHARRHGQPGALLFCDLDKFKPVNDEHGHAVGDQVLAVVARRLESQVRAGDTTARFGGDEFVIVAENLVGQELDELIERLRSAVAAPIEINGTLFSVAMTIGHVSIDPEAADNPAELLQSADAEMYRLKP
jgi:diguanylate cyclase (GGDEF)-like protein/PAS domain S-box-containing protein